MQSWVIGDVHGCGRTLRALLAALELDESTDRLWLVGDLVNRGPDSLGVLRWARRTRERMGERFVCVLGNHDLHLLGVAAGVRPERERDTLTPVLAAPDGPDLLELLAGLPLAHLEDGDLLVHAGLLPAWSAAEAVERAARVARALADPARRRDLTARAVDGEDGELAALRRDLGVLTGVRTLSADLTPCGYAGPLEDVPEGCVPWFSWPARAATGTRVFFGHWAALGLHVEDDVVGLDTGCSWGGELTAFRREDGAVRSQPLVDEI